MAVRIPKNCELCKEPILGEEYLFVYKPTHAGKNARPSIVNYCVKCYSMFVKDELPVSWLRPVTIEEAEALETAFEILTE